MRVPSSREVARHLIDQIDRIDNEKGRREALGKLYDAALSLYSWLPAGSDKFARSLEETLYRELDRRNQAANEAAIAQGERDYQAAVLGEESK